MVGRLRGALNGTVVRPSHLPGERKLALVRTLLAIAAAAALVWLVMTLANEFAGIEIVPDGGFFQFPEIRFDRADELRP